MTSQPIPEVLAPCPNPDCKHPCEFRLLRERQVGQVWCTQRCGYEGPIDIKTRAIRLHNSICRPSATASPEPIGELKITDGRVSFHTLVPVDKLSAGPVYSRPESSRGPAIFKYELLLIQDGIDAFMRWLYENTSEFVTGDKKFLPSHDERYQSDVSAMRNARRILPELIERFDRVKLPVSHPSPAAPREVREAIERAADRIQTASEGRDGTGIFASEAVKIIEAELAQSFSVNQGAEQSEKSMEYGNKELRANFEAWYIQNCFDLESNPIGSRQCDLQWRAWAASKGYNSAGYLGTETGPWPRPKAPGGVA